MKPAPAKMLLDLHVLLPFSITIIMTFPDTTCLNILAQPRANLEQINKESMKHPV